MYGRGSAHRAGEIEIFKKLTRKLPPDQQAGGWVFLREEATIAGLFDTNETISE